jgi:hypothetical protein
MQSGGSGKGKLPANLIPILHGFSKNFLRVDYMFWVNQEPYFEKDVMPCFESEK